MQNSIFFGCLEAYKFKVTHCMTLTKHMANCSAFPKIKNDLKSTPSGKLTADR